MATIPLKLPQSPEPSGGPHSVQGATILIVDDVPENLALLAEILRPAYRVRAARSGERALAILTHGPLPDLILLDIMMPGMDGHQVFRWLRADPRTSQIPVLFVTALDMPQDEERGLDLGAVDYITKPLRAPVLLARVRTQLELKRARDFLRDQNTFLEAEVARRMQENQVIQDVSIHALARLAEIRDPETGNHLRRTQEYVRTLARQLRDNPRFRSLLSDRTIDLLAKSAPLHDIGKVGIPDHILLKPGKLTAEEWVVMKTHSTLGAQAIERAKQDATLPVEFLDMAQEIANFHHERWDGSGYPCGLVGDAIPVSARLMALADVFDALVCARVYKPAFPFPEARAMIEAQRGKHFDPDVVDAFVATFPTFRAIAERYRDADALSGSVPERAADA
jgi:putative two-component system response regulator